MESHKDPRIWCDEHLALNTPASQSVPIGANVSRMRPWHLKYSDAPAELRSELRSMFLRKKKKKKLHQIQRFGDSISARAGFTVPKTVEHKIPKEAESLQQTKVSRTLQRNMVFQNFRSTGVQGGESCELDAWYTSFRAAPHWGMGYTSFHLSLTCGMYAQQCPGTLLLMEDHLHVEARKHCEYLLSSLVL